jgi:hypothetical protein
MEILLNKILPALIGFIAGALGSIVAPWVNWGIEKKREKLKYKREMIKSWREFINLNSDWDNFRDTAVFSEMKPFLSQYLISEIDPPDFEDGKVVINLRSPIGRDSLKARLLEEITRLELKWKLL